MHKNLQKPSKNRIYLCKTCAIGIRVYNNPVHLVILSDQNAKQSQFGDSVMIVCIYEYKNYEKNGRFVVPK